jgi:hypothetical protein
VTPIMANIAAGLVGQTLQVHTIAGQYAGTLEAVIGGVLRIRGGGTVYDVDLAHVVAMSYPAPAPTTTTTVVITPWSCTTQGFIDGHRDRAA